MEEKSSDKGVFLKSKGYWWLATILAPVFGISLGLLAFLCGSGNIMGHHEGFYGLEFIIFPMIGFTSGTLLSFVFMVISIAKKERHTGKTILFLMICLLLNVFLYFG